RLATGGNQADLLRVARVRLLDGDDIEEAHRTGFVAPDALHAGNSRAFNGVPNHAGLYDGPAEGHVRRRAHGRGHREDGIVAMIDAPNADDGLLARRARVVP